MLVAVLLIGCNKNDHGEIVLPDTDRPIFYASVESLDSRTYLDEGAKMRWTNDDRISIFVGENYNREFAFTGATGSTAGGFTQKSTDGFYTAEKVSANYAVYPHYTSTLLETEGYFSVAMPSSQTYAEGSFGLNANTMVAVTESTSDMFLQFKNVCGYLKLNLYGDDISVKRITLRGNSAEPLAGRAYVTPAFEGAPTLSWMSGATSETLTLDCGEGVKIGATEAEATSFWLVVPPTVFKGGFTIQVINTEQKMYEKKASSEQIITRNISKNMPALKVVCDQEAPNDEGDDSGNDEPVVTYDVPNNQIWYKTKYDFAAVLATETLTNANLRAHTYENGIGKLVFDNDVTQIATDAFNGLDPITHVWLPDCLKTIGQYAFRDCTGLMNIDIPEGVASIGSSAFSGCTGLTSVALPSSLTSIGGSAFYNCTGLTSIDLPEGLTSIGGSAFYNCTGLTNITIPKSVTTFGSTVFSGCTGVLTVRCNLPDGSYSTGYPIMYPMKEAAFSEVKIAEGVTSIGSYAFYDCTGLTSIDLPESLISIGSYAFYDCTGLTSIDLPESLTSIGSSAFYNCTSLTSIDLPSSLTSIGGSAFRNCTGLTSIDLPSSLTSIGSSAFSGCTGLTSIDLPSSLTSIGDSAFYNCTGLTSITIPNGVTSIGYATFQDCTELASIALPESLTSIGYCAFSGCKGLTSIDIPDGVTSIGYEAFRNCTSLTNITIPKSVTSFGNAVFSGCTGVLTIHCNLPDGSNSTTVYPIYPMKEAAFSEVKIAEGVTSIGSYAFYDCTGLTSIDFPESLTSIGSCAFYNCTSLTSITIPKSVTSFGKDVFDGCTAALTIHCNLPNKSSSNQYPMRGAAFSEVKIAEGVTSIGSYAFFGCTTTSIDLPESLTSIGDSAFYGCTYLRSIYCRALTPPICYSDTFYKVTAKIYVPQEALSAYQAALYWKSMNLVGYEFE